MLVLSRKKNEIVVVNDDIVVVVVEIRRDKVRLGVKAPPEIPVHRGEVYDAIQTESGSLPTSHANKGETDGSEGAGGFLVLSRKQNERIVIGSGITVVVVQIRGDKVRLGFEAPSEIPVHRKEVFDAIHRRSDPPPAQG